jgi:hypothetical protein
MIPDISASLSRMTLEEKAGQVIFAGFEGSAPSSSLCEYIAGLRLGGMVIFQRNVAGRSQLADLISAAQGCARLRGLGQQRCPRLRAAARPAAPRLLH